MFSGKACEQPLRILQVGTADTLGGAERLAWNLFQSYRDRGHKSWLAVGRKYTSDPDVFRIPNERKETLWFRLSNAGQKELESFEQRLPGVWRLRQCLRTWSRPWHAVQRSLGMEDFDYPGSRRLLTLPPEKPDIVHCHNLHGNYFDLRVLSRLTREAPVILHLHDAWLLSGHCAHSFDCERWKTGCGECPDLSIYPALERDGTHYNWTRKRDIMANGRFYVTAPSQWLMDKATQSIVAPSIVEAKVIPNAVDVSVFHPADRRHVRRMLGVPQEAQVLLFAAHGIRANIWKDYQTMRSAVSQIAERLQDHRLIFIALGEDGPPERVGNAEVQFVPYQKDPGAVARYYQAANVYIHAARAEAWGLAITESLACGTPVVATAVGGIPEQVKGLHSPESGSWGGGLNRYDRDEATGILVPSGDAQAMAASIERLLIDDPLRLCLGENAASDAAKRFDLKTQADRYLDWYQHIVNNHAGVSSKQVCVV